MVGGDSARVPSPSPWASPSVPPWIQPLPPLSEPAVALFQCYSRPLQCLETWKQPKCPSADEQIKKLWYICTWNAMQL